MRAVPLAGVVACVLSLLLATTEAAAQEVNCRNFSWSMGRTIDLFDEPLPTVQNNQALPKEGAFALLLKPAADVIYLTPPERGSDSGLGGVVTIESIPAGRYQIALSDDAWVDAIQGNAHLPALASSRTRECPGVVRSVDVEVKGEPLTLQIGGAHAQRINIAVVRVWPFEWRW
jgi:hypothetical protein